MNTAFLFLARESRIFFFFSVEGVFKASPSRECALSAKAGRHHSLRQGLGVALEMHDLNLGGLSHEIFPSLMTDLKNHRTQALGNCSQVP